MTTEHHRFCDDNGWDHPGECPIAINRPEDHIDDHGGPILMIGGDVLTNGGAVRLEPIDHGFALWFVCDGCGQKWCAAIDFDEMEVAD